jgi:hypothetical protein
MGAWSVLGAMREQLRMTIDDSIEPRLDELRERLRALEAGIRVLQARLAAWDRTEPPRDDKPARESVPLPVIAAMVDP